MTLSVSSPCLELELEQELGLGLELAGDSSGTGRKGAGSEYPGGERELCLTAVSDFWGGPQASVELLIDR